MTQKFNVGNTVKIKETGQIGTVIDFKFGNIVAHHHDTHIDNYDDDELELVPHPDTVRLDFIQNSSAEIQFYHTSDEYDDDYDTEWFSLSTPRCDLRETIDETMQEQAP